MEQTDLLQDDVNVVRRNLALSKATSLSNYLYLCITKTPRVFLSICVQNTFQTRDDSVRNVRNEWVMPTWIQVPLLERLRRARAIAMTTVYKTSGNRKGLSGVKRDGFLKQETACYIHVSRLWLNRGQTTRAVKQRAFLQDSAFQGDAYGRQRRPNPAPLNPSSLDKNYTSKLLNQL